MYDRHLRAHDSVKVYVNKEEHKVQIKILDLTKPTYMMVTYLIRNSYYL